MICTKFCLTSDGLCEGLGVGGKVVGSAVQIELIQDNVPGLQHGLFLVLQDVPST